MGVPATKLNELQLAHRAREGDEAALVQLYRRHREALFRHAWRMLGDEATAQDMVQEAFARAIPAMARTRAELNFRAWIYRIVTNLCLRELNQRGRTKLRSEQDSLGESEPPRTPDQKICEQLTAALERLPGRYRQILLLREIEELSYVELAQVLELSEGNVKVLLHRARTRFAALFIAERLLSEPDTVEVSCEALSELLRSGKARRDLERHLEGCNVCRQLEGRPAIELLGLLPAPPTPTFPNGELAGAGGGAAGGVSTALVVSVVVGAAALVGAIIFGVLVVQDDRTAEHRVVEQSHVVQMERTGPKTRSHTEPRVGAHSTRAEPQPGQPDLTNKMTAPPSAPESRTKRLHRRRSRVSRTRVQQAVDPESPPN